MSRTHFDFIDWMRVVLVVAIVAIHATQVYNPAKTWYVYHLHGSEIATFILMFLTLFSLQAFFLISGFLAAMSIEYKGVDAFFDSRVKRIVVPIVTAALTLNLIQYALVSRYHGESFSFTNYFSEGEWVSHLWFLIDLAILFGATYVLLRFGRSVLRFFRHLAQMILAKGVWFSIIFFAFANVAIATFYSLTSDMLENNIVNVKSILYYSLFYSLGALLFYDITFFKQVVSMPLWSYIATAAISSYGAQRLEELQSTVAKIGHYFLDGFASFAATLALFALFYRYFNRKNSTIKLLSNASYSVYLFHHLFVIAIAMVIIPFGWPMFLEWLVIFIGGGMAALCIHRCIIEKFSLFAFLLNGKALKDNKSHT